MATLALWTLRSVGNLRALTSGHPQGGGGADTEWRSHMQTAPGILGPAALRRCERSFAALKERGHGQVTAPRWRASACARPRCEAEFTVHARTKAAAADLRARGAASLGLDMHVPIS